MKPPSGKCRRACADKRVEDHVARIAALPDERFDEFYWLLVRMLYCLRSLEPEYVGKSRIAVARLTLFQHNDAFILPPKAVPPTPQHLIPDDNISDGIFGVVLKEATQKAEVPAAAEHIG